MHKDLVQEILFLSFTFAIKEMGTDILKLKKVNNCFLVVGTVSVRYCKVSSALTSFVGGCTAAAKSKARLLYN